MTLAFERRPHPDAVDRILRALPDWFGFEQAIVNYVERASILDSYLAVADGHTIAVALIERHFPQAAELALIAVDPAGRGGGVGRRLLDEVERVLRADGCRLLEVHTVRPSYQSEAYASTRAFYAATGFDPMHEFDKLDWDGPTLILIKSLYLPPCRARGRCSLRIPW